MTRLQQRSFLLILLCGGPVLLSFFLSPEEGEKPGLCLFKRTTGFDCVGCGLTRGFVAISHGGFSEAYGLNPMSFIVYLAFVLVAFFATLSFLGWFEFPKLPEPKPWAYVVLVGAVLVLWIHRAMDWSGFSSLP